MDAERERIQADLRGLISGEVRCDELFTQLYASDASLYEIRPLGVVRPLNTTDVVATVRYAAERNLPLHARGAGTGLAGESVGPGIVVDFSHSMRRILSTDGATVRLQPGVVHAQLNQFLAPRGRLFGPDPAMSAVTTMGSVLALDNTGSHWLRYGSPRGRVTSLEVVLANGIVIEAGRHPIDDPAAADPNCPPAIAARATIVRRLAELLQREQALIDNHQPRSAVNRSGYRLHGVLQDGHLDLAKLLVGSEGTLALITEATIVTDPLPKATGVALLFCDRLDSAARAALEATRIGVSACDLMDRRLLSIARETDPRFAQLISTEAEAMLLVEVHADDTRTAREQLQDICYRLQRKKKLVFDSRVTLDLEEIELFWRLPGQVVSRLYSLKGADRPIPFVEDLAIPPETLPDFIVRLQNVLKTYQVTATLFAHAGHGQLHLRPFLDLANAEEVRKMQDLATSLYEQVLEVGGTISGEHGDGLSRTWFVKRQYGPLYDVFREVKRIFDPQNIFNPGKVVAEAPQPLTKNLRPLTAVSSPSSAAGSVPDLSVSKPSEPLQLHLIWESGAIGKAASACNGCGQCRSQTLDTRMCPIFRFAPREEASPRSKANLMRAALSGQVPASELASSTFKEITDLCVNCHQCRTECPANVDIPKLMVEAKAQHIAMNGMGVADWFLSRLDKVAFWASLSSSFSNWALANPQMRWLLSRFLGIAHGRKLPRVSANSFLALARRRRWTRPAKHPGRSVLYFVDLYANWFDVQLAEAVVQVLEHNGVSVYVHPEQRPSAMAKISLGDVERARPIARENITLLAEAVRQGYHVVTSEPSAAMALIHEYPNLVEDDDARLVANNTSEVCSYLWRLHQVGKLELDMRPLNVTLGYHLPCHSRVLDPAAPAEQLLRLIPGITVQRIEKGCSGMAGTFGLKRENYRASLRAGWGLISALRDARLQAGTSECSACKIQMEQGTTKPTIHPLKILALAYGLKPEFASLLTHRGEELIVS